MPYLLKRQSGVKLKKHCDSSEQSYEKARKLGHTRRRRDQHAFSSSSKHARVQEEKMLTCAFFKSWETKGEQTKAKEIMQRVFGREETQHPDTRRAGEPGQAQRVSSPPELQVGLSYSLSEALSPKKGSCSIMSMGILMLGTFSL